MPSFTKFAPNRASGAATAEIGNQRQPETSPDGRALDRAHYGSLVSEQAGCFAVENSGGVSEAILGKIPAPGIVVLSRAEIRAGAEVLSL